MSSAARLFEVLRADMKAKGLTYRELAQRIGMSESSVKRMFGEQDMPLSRLAQVSEAVGTPFEDLLARAARSAPELARLTLEQERALVADPRLLLVAICCLSQWSVEQMLATYALTPAEVVAALARLDRLGLVELRPGNRYRLAVGRSFHWRREGPVIAYLRRHVVDEFFDAGFDGRGEALVTVHGQLSVAGAADLAQRVGQLAGAFVQRQRDDQRDPAAACDGYTLIVGLRSFELSAFTAMRRRSAQRTMPEGSSTEPRKR
ncbi:MAG: helix-turn-helix domain-containing protein [Betaproteobacteria bacterium]|jgi:transcriptional regulator with XRE-family HTH domain|nr:helix-turn-helix domain-containing protein [Burkholderiaceae bacterium]MCZ8112151.1 helix-turn-helix transcriptional regulator [Rubrivivax sp.]MCZ8175774.1 helix-turn-helix transcriptional regulator [Burkholderiaceae bacterium]